MKDERIVRIVAASVFVFVGFTIAWTGFYEKDYGMMLVGTIMMIVPWVLDSKIKS